MHTSRMHRSMEAEQAGHDWRDVDGGDEPQAGSEWELVGDGAARGTR